MFNRRDLVRALTSVPLGIEKYLWEPQLLSRREASAVINTVFDTILEALNRGETVMLPFGTFEVVERTPQPGRSRSMRSYRKSKYIRFTEWFSLEDGRDLLTPGVGEGIYVEEPGEVFPWPKAEAPAQAA